MQKNHSVLRVVELAEDIYIKTAIPRDSQPALRSGFAGYPSNPRWSLRKHHAWKQGRQWRLALNSGKMIVKDKHLIVFNRPRQSDSPPPPLNPEGRSPLRQLAFTLG